MSPGSRRGGTVRQNPIAARATVDGPIDKAIGDESRVAVVLHECMHSVDFSGTSGSDDIHISEFDPAYDVQPANQSIFNPSSYASFAAHMHEGEDPSPRFGLARGSARPVTGPGGDSQARFAYNAAWLQVIGALSSKTRTIKCHCNKQPACWD